MITIRSITREDQPRLRKFWVERWGDETIVAHGVVYRVDTMDGFLALDGREIVGTITLAHSDDDCEIVSIDSVREEKGIGTSLLEAAIKAAREKGCKRLFLITTNDNLPALGFFQKRGFELSALHRGAVNESRKIKLSIPPTGHDDIPIRDELELEMNL
ncbi:MAG: GNAT family N-acetyltransferase [Chloroflexi bacterium]|nr:GNAT family N-acetyltransferase [Chloroflexota bacterium]